MRSHARSDRLRSKSPAPMCPTHPEPRAHSDWWIAAGKLQYIWNKVRTQPETGRRKPAAPAVSPGSADPIPHGIADRPYPPKAVRPKRPGYWIGVLRTPHLQGEPAPAQFADS